MLGVIYYEILMDRIIPNQWIYTLRIVSLGFIFLAIVRILLDIIRVYMTLKLSQNLNGKLSMGFYKHVLRLPMQFHDSRKVGDIVSRFKDTTEIQEILASASLTLLVDIVFVAIGSIILVIKSIKLFLVVLIMCIAYIFAILVFQKKYSIYNISSMENNAKVTSYLVDSLEGIDTIKSYCIEKNIYETGKIKFKELLNAIFILGKTENIQYALKALIGFIGEICILWIGGIEVINGRMSIGELITFNVLIGYFLRPVNNLVNLQSQIQTAIAAARRLEEVMNLPEEHQGGIKNLEIESVLFDNVSFGYIKEKWEIENINISVKKGQKIALVGESGSGKTTIIKLLLKFYDLESGKIIIGDNLIQNIDTHFLRSKISYASQDDFIFSGSIVDNLTLGNIEITREEITQAIKSSCAYGFISKLPQGVNTMLEEKGENLSKGQRQRIVLARALLKKPDILIMDEATSNLDASTESMIYRTLHKYKQNMILIVVTHKLNTIIDSDLICVIKDGKIVGKGNHSELLQNCQDYIQYIKKQTF